MKPIAARLVMPMGVDPSRRGHESHRSVCGQRARARRSSAAAQTAPAFDPGPAVAPCPDARLRRLRAAARRPAAKRRRSTISSAVPEAGLQPGGDLVNGKRQWTQAVPLLKSDIAGTPQLQAAHPGRPRAAGPGRADRGALADQRPDGGAPRRRAVRVRRLRRHRARAPVGRFQGPATSRGKVIVVLINDPDFEGARPTLRGDFGGKAMTYYGRWTYKYEEAARRGAAGVLVVHETEPASYGWATVKNSNTNTMFDIVRKDPAAEHAADRKLDPARHRGRSVPRRRARFRSRQAGRPAPRLPADRPQGDADRQRRRQDRDHQLLQCRRRCCPARPVPTRQ